MLPADQVLSRLTPYLAGLREIPLKAWRAYEALPPGARVMMSKRSRASFVHDAMVVEATRMEARCTGVRTFERQGLTGLLFDDSIAIRLKKFDLNSQSRNIPTDQVIAFRNQILIPGINAHVHLELGYVLDSLHMSVAEVRLVAPSGASNRWEYRLEAESPTAVITDLFDAMPAAELIPPRVFIRERTAEKKSKDS
jgi:hypothetical protein